MQINRQNVKWFGRMAVILVVVVALDGLVVAFARKPLPWAAMIPGLIPILTSVVIILPLNKAVRLVPPSA